MCSYVSVITVKLQLHAQVLFTCELCKAISGHINLYRTILVPYNNYASSTTPTSSHMYVQPVLQTFIRSSRFCTSHSSKPQIVELVMALLHYSQSMASLPTAKETRLRDTVTQSANAAVLREIQQVKWPRMRKAYTEMLDRQKHMN